MKKLSKEQILKIKKLARKGHSLNHISREMKLSKSTIYYHAKAFVKKNSKVNLTKLTEWERGYLVGFFVGDGNFDIRKDSYSYRIVFNLNYQSDSKIAKRLLSIIRKSGGKPYTTRYKNLLRVICISKKLYEYIKGFVIYRKVRRWKRVISKKMGIKETKKWSKNFKLGFISGMIDSDGYVGPDRNSIRVLISTSSKLLARQLHELCKDINLSSTIQKSTTKKTLTIRLSTPSFLKFFTSINCVKGRWSNGRTGN